MSRPYSENKLSRFEVFKGSWRPGYGWCIGLSFAWLAGCVGWLIVTNPTEAPAAITALAGLSGIWIAALGALSLSVHQRSKDKQTAAGIVTPGLVSSIKDIVRGRPEPQEEKRSDAGQPNPD